MSQSLTRHPDGYPRYPDGDVEVVISGARRYLLHAEFLRRMSPELSELLSVAGPKLNKRARERGRTARHRLVLTEREDGEWVFLRDELDASGQSMAGARFGIGNEYGIIVPDLHRHFDMLFHALYSKQIPFDTTSVSTILADVVGLVEVAEQLGAVQLVSTGIERAFLSKGQQFWVSISTDPISWIKLAQKLHSRVIFKDALIHIVGRYNELADPLLECVDGVSTIKDLDPEVTQLVKAKHKALMDFCRRVDGHLASHYPATLLKTTETGQGGVERSTRREYSNDVFGWMALSFFRHFLGNELCNGNTRLAKDNGFKFYENLYIGGDRYMNKDHVAQFFHHFPISLRAQNVIFGHINAIKADLRDAVKDLMESRCELDVKAYPVPWLTCTSLRPEEYHFRQSVTRTAHQIATRNETTPRKTPGKGKERRGTGAELYEYERMGTGSFSTPTKKSSTTPKMPQSMASTAARASALRSSPDDGPPPPPRFAQRPKAIVREEDLAVGSEADDEPFSHYHGLGLKTPPRTASRLSKAPKIITSPRSKPLPPPPAPKRRAPSPCLPHSPIRGTHANSAKGKGKEIDYMDTIPEQSDDDLNRGGSGTQVAAVGHDRPSFILGPNTGPVSKRKALWETGLEMIKSKMPRSGGRYPHAIAAAVAGDPFGPAATTPETTTVRHRYEEPSDRERNPNTEPSFDPWTNDPEIDTMREWRERSIDARMAAEAMIGLQTMGDAFAGATRDQGDPDDAGRGTIMPSVEGRGSRNPSTPVEPDQSSSSSTSNSAARTRPVSPISPAGTVGPEEYEGSPLQRTTTRRGDSTSGASEASPDRQDVKMEDYDADTGAGAA